MAQTNATGLETEGVAALATAWGAAAGLLDPEPVVWPVPLQAVAPAKRQINAMSAQRRRTDMGLTPRYVHTEQDRSMGGWRPQPVPHTWSGWSVLPRLRIALCQFLNTSSAAWAYDRQVSRTAARSLFVMALLLGGFLAVGASHWLPVARGQEQTPLAGSATPAPSVTPSATAAEPATATVRIDAYNDASVVSGGLWTADTNLGGWTDLAVGAQQGGMFRSYLRFVLAGLPPGLQIDSAQLFLTPLQTGSQPVNITADVVQEDWNEASITWNQQPLTTWQAGAATWQPGQGGPFTIDLTQAARSWYACGGATNFGVELSADLSSDWVLFGSRKSAYTPVLQITYEATSAPLDCTAAPASSGSQAPAQPAPSTSGAQLGSQTISTPVPIATNPGMSPCPTIFCLSRGSDVTNNTGTASTGSSSTGSSSSGSSSSGAPKATATAGG